MRPSPTIALVPVAVLALTTACTAEQEPAPRPTGPTPTAVAVEPVVRTVVLDGEEVELEVGPVAVHGDVAVLRLAAPTQTPFLRMALWDVFENLSSPGPSGVRLVDSEEGVVRPVARDERDRAVMSGNSTPGGPATDAGDEAADGDEVVYAAFAATDAERVDVMLPEGGWVADVPVVPADDAGALTVPPEELAEGGVADAPVFPLEAYTEVVGGAVRARETPEAVTVQVASDVLFAVDSDQLGPEAEAALAAAAAQVTAYPGGAVTVVGHTDDVADDAYNLDLSQRRAATVAARLAQVADLSAFDVTVDAKGESQPAAAGTSPDARALNRRVEIVLVPQGEPEAAEPVAGEVPAAEGPVAPGAEGLTYQDGDDTFTVRLPEVRREGRYLVGELELTHAAGDSESIDGVLASGAWDARGEFDASLQFAATNVTLLEGDRRTYALDYVRRVVGDRSIREPLADRLVNVVPVGGTRTVTVVWPDAGQESVTVDVSVHYATSANIPFGGPAFRLTDVPVVDG